MAHFAKNRSIIVEEGIEPATRREQNPKQVALLPAIALISHRFVPPLHPVSSHLVPFNSPLEGHTGGTCGPASWSHSRTRVARASPGHSGLTKAGEGHAQGEIAPPSRLRTWLVGP